jgi:tRNA1Val (adenine37-N6)-methyltransferase
MIHHDRCPMKVGTDGVLLGAVTEPADAECILDAGCGSGLIAIMLAQRSNAQITGVEIDAESCAQAAENAAASPWADRLEMVNQSLQDFAENHPDCFDLIVCNPPFFGNSLKSIHSARNLVRHDTHLNFSDLCLASAKLLRGQGRLSVIYPSNAEWRFSNAATDAGFGLKSRIRIIPKQGKAAHRNIDLWVREEHAEPQLSELCIYKTDDSYTEEYTAVCRDYYLFF